jgi:hypothetical protein
MSKTNQGRVVQFGSADIESVSTGWQFGDVGNGWKATVTQSKSDPTVVVLDLESLVPEGYDSYMPSISLTMPAYQLTGFAARLTELLEQRGDEASR